jgi:signal transduction histidine kinase
MQDLWTTVQRIPDSPVEHESIYEFLMKEVSPRRQAATNTVERLEEANRAALNQSEADLATTRKSYGRLLLLLLGIDALIGLAVAVYSLRQSEQLEAQTQAQLLEASRARQELERLSARLMEIQEQERTRLARELHDDIVQNLAVLKIEITQAQKSADLRSTETAERLDRARSIADRTMKTLRSTMLLLRPSLLDDLGLAAAMRQMAKQVEARSGVAILVTVAGSRRRLISQIETVLYRIAQEALNNAVRHAHAARVTIDLKFGERCVSLEIADNGVGFAPGAVLKAQAARRAWGLLGMQERVTLVGGKLEIHSAPGQGTRLTAEVPLAVAEVRTDHAHSDSAG